MSPLREAVWPVSAGRLHYLVSCFLCTYNFRLKAVERRVEVDVEVVDLLRASADEPAAVLALRSDSLASVDELTKELVGSPLASSVSSRGGTHYFRNCLLQLGGQRRPAPLLGRHHCSNGGDNSRR